MVFSEETMRDLYWAIEEVLNEMDMTMDFAALDEDPVYCNCCGLLNRYDEGDRSLNLFEEMRDVYAMAS